MAQQIAVLTGDLFNSTGLGPDNVDRAMNTLRHCAADQSDWMSDIPVFSQHRGDGWQVAIPEARHGLRAAALFRASLRALGDEYDSYIGIAEGDYAWPPGPDLNTEYGKVFEISGRALDIAKRSGFHMNHSAGGGHEATAIFLNRICQEWTPAQALTTTFALAPNNDPNQTDIAERLGKSRQAVAKSLRAAWNDEIREALLMLESSYD